MTPFHIAAFIGQTALNAASQNRANRINQLNYENYKHYNSPSAQMARFRSAGLNPNLIYTQSNNVDAPPDWQSNQYDFTHLASAADELIAYQNIDESRHRVNNLEKTNSLLDEQILSQAIENEFKRSEKELNIEQLKANVDKTLTEIDKIVNEIDINNKKISLDYFNTIFNIALDKLKYDLDVERFEEMKRQFNINNRTNVLLYNFFRGLLGRNPENAALSLGAAIKKFLLMIPSGT